MILTGDVVAFPGSHWVLSATVNGPRSGGDEGCGRPATAFSHPFCSPRPPINFFPSCELPHTHSSTGPPINQVIATTDVGRLRPRGHPKMNISYPPAVRRQLLSKHFLMSSMPERALDELVKFSTVAR